MTFLFKQHNRLDNHLTCRGQSVTDAEVLLFFQEHIFTVQSRCRAAFAILNNKFKASFS